MPGLAATVNLAPACGLRLEAEACPDVRARNSCELGGGRRGTATGACADEPSRAGRGAAAQAAARRTIPHASTVVGKVRYRADGGAGAGGRGDVRERRCVVCVKPPWRSTPRSAVTTLDCVERRYATRIRLFRIARARTRRVAGNQRYTATDRISDSVLFTSVTLSHHARSGSPHRSRSIHKDTHRDSETARLNRPRPLT